MNKGILFGLSAYLLWGIFPVYLKALQTVPPLQLLGHRIVWSFLFVMILLALRKDIGVLRKAFTPRILLVYLAAGLLLAVNWGTFVWAVNSGYVVESSLGYFINPLVSVVLGMVFLRERLRLGQWIPVGLAAAGVAYLTISYGTPPWIALVLAFTFGLYGLIKKLSPLSALPGLAIETAVIFLPALAYLVYVEAAGIGAFGHVESWQSVLLALAGVVTAVPLLLFAAGVRRIPLSIFGLLQYVTPTGHFLLGVLVYNEPFTLQRLVGFSIIWLALILFTAESFLAYRRQRLAAAAV